MEQETDFLHQLASQNPSVMGVVGWTDLRAAQLEERLERWTQHPALRGFRHIVQDEPDVPGLLNDAAFQRGVAQLQRRALSYDVLLFGHQLPDAQAFCARHDSHWLVLDHVGKPALRDWALPDLASRWRKQLRALAQLPHLMCKLSGLVTETAWSSADALTAQDHAAIRQCCDDALEAFGPQRLMFGSDWPVCQLAAPYAQVADSALLWVASRLSSSEQDAFWSGNAVRAYGLTLPHSPSA
jgi:L-fuconolactonase